MHKKRTMEKEKRKKRIRIKLRARSSGRPRLSVFVSNKHIYTQIIDDQSGRTLVSATDREVEQKGGKTVDVAKRIGELLAKKVKSLPAGRQGTKVSKVVFDRGGRKYHGRLRALAEGARAGGLKF